MKVYWNDCGEGPTSDAPVELDLAQTQLVWSDEVRGVEGNFLGITDGSGNTVQFYFTEGIPDDVEDASDLTIVLVDFPVIEEGGSYSKQVAIGEVAGLIAKVFEMGASYRSFSGLRFVEW